MHKTNGACVNCDCAMCREFFRPVATRDLSGKQGAALEAKADKADTWIGLAEETIRELHGAIPETAKKVCSECGKEKS